MTGARRGARWQRVFDHESSWPLPPKDAGETEMMREFEASPFFQGLDPSPEARRVLNYAITEMLNNAIDHSSGNKARLSARVDGSSLTVVIADDGVGALQHVREHFGLASDDEALAHIAKGQQTTAPEHHSGQGLFFTSRMVDQFELDSGTLRWVVDNERGRPGRWSCLGRDWHPRHLAAPPGSASHATRDLRPVQ